MPHALFSAACHSRRTRNTSCPAQRSTRGAVALARRHFHLGLHLGFGVAFGVGRFAASPPPRACALGSATAPRSPPQRPPAPDVRSHLVTGATRPPPRSVAVAQLPPAQPHDVYVTLAASLVAPPSRSPPCALTRCPLHPLHITKTALWTLFLVRQAKSRARPNAVCTVATPAAKRAGGAQRASSVACSAQPAQRLDALRASAAGLAARRRTERRPPRTPFCRCAALLRCRPRRRCLCARSRSRGSTPPDCVPRSAAQRQASNRHRTCRFESCAALQQAEAAATAQALNGGARRVS